MTQPSVPKKCKACVVHQSDNSVENKMVMCREFCGKSANKKKSKLPSDV